jgi:hypothetical protein
MPEIGATIPSLAAASLVYLAIVKFTPGRKDQVSAK